MRRLIFFLGIVLACAVGMPMQAAHASAALVTLKLCPDGSTVAYSAKCPTSGTVRKICPSGDVVAYSASCPSVSTGVLAQPTRKLCLPSNATVGYSATCPPGTTVTKKICPYGQIVAYSAKCPTTPPPAPLASGDKVRANLACQSLMNPNDALTVDGVYRVTGFAHASEIGTVSFTNTNRDYVILDGFDGKHWGDGYFSWWVPINCVESVSG